MCDQSAPSASSQSSPSSDMPVAIVVLGMAGSGKTTFVQRMVSHLYTKKQPPYVVNLDPAVHEVPYPANIDIRDTVNYKEVMTQHKLGPNGAIMTSLNLFATRFDQVMGLLQKRQHEHKYIVIDTPGQIEVFTWSASGTIITETLCDIVRATNLVEWMRDFEAFEAAIQQESTYISDLSRSLSLVLEEFYNVLECVEFSSLTGFGCDAFLESVAKAKIQYEKEYKPEYERLLKAKEDAALNEQKKQMERLSLDRKEDRAMAAMSTGTEMLTGTPIYLGSVNEEGIIDEEPIKEEIQQGLDSDDDPEEDKEDFRKFLATVKKGD